MAVSSGIRITLGTKISLAVALVLVSAVASLIWLSTKLYIEDNTALIQQMNADTATALASRVRELSERSIEKMTFFGTVALQELGAGGVRTSLAKDLFAKEDTLLSVLLYEHKSPPLIRFSGMIPALEMAGVDAGKIGETFSREPDFSFDGLKRGEIQLCRVKMPDGEAAIAIGVPFVGASGNFTHSLVGMVRQARFLEPFAELDLGTAFLVDGKGRLVAHQDARAAAVGGARSHLPIVQELLKGKFNNGLIRYVDPGTEEAKLGAFKVVGLGGLGVVAEMPEAKAFEVARWVQYRASLVAVIVLCVAVLFAHLFSDTITAPVYDLVRAAARIARGDFDIDLQPRSRDEVGYLSRAFNAMAKGLEERDRVKATFSKFHNKEIAERLLAGEVKLGGERRQAAVLFTDIRGFTALSETMEPEKVVDMLNEYMSRMVKIIADHGGLVDKFVGDAIMALWGVPIEHEDDAENAVRACLEMREQLVELNEVRMKRGDSALRIGMGLNFGPLTAGNIGSSERMEYTVIGDTVNLASRVESATKEKGCDLLISGELFEQVRDKFIFEGPHPMRVKGKSADVDVYLVHGYFDAKGQPVEVRTPYSEFEPEKKAA